MAAAPAAIAEDLLAWYDVHGRRDLPWKRDADPYRIWLSEIMLQQTQVTTVLPYFERFTAAFPDVGALAAADIDAVLSLWTGLGYYARARNLHRAAQLVCDAHDGAFPASVDALMGLPGVGRSTAGAIAAMAYGVRAPILDGNVRRVLCRLAGIEGWPGERAVEQRLWLLADAMTPAARPGDYTQAIMDLGATLCTRRRPACERCPLVDRCAAHASGRVDAIPAPRPKKPKPERATRMLMIQDPDGAVLLERRPATGLWGGLWCFPQQDLDDDPEAQVAEHLLLPADGISATEPWGEFVHVFTHFRLRVHPLRVHLALRPDNVRDGDLDWFDPASEPDVGLAAPVKRLLGLLAGGDLLSPGRRSPGPQTPRQKRSSR
ncbi:MAG TPA: A/G-specific adenine glycosylase [Pseudomonadales bacterium]|nr:A/G-specific adenine glycosylase [Pseudomonadales bacterium]